LEFKGKGKGNGEKLEKFFIAARFLVL